MIFRPIVVLLLTFVCEWSVAADLPTLQLEDATIEIPLVKPYIIGKEPEPQLVRYSVRAQRFGEGLVVDLPSQGVTPETLASVCTSPYMTVFLGLYADKISDDTGRLLLSSPACADMLAGRFSKENNKRTTELFKDVASVKLLLTIEQDERLFVFYRLVDLKGTEKRPVYFRALKNMGPIWLFDCEPVSEQVILNVFSVLVSQGVAGVKFISLNE